jgi:periplasmic protein TonB
LPSYRLPSPHDRPPLQRRASGLALALGVNVGLVLLLLTLGVIPLPEQKPSRATVVDLLPESHSRAEQVAAAHPRSSDRPVPKPPPIILPVKPTIIPPPVPEKKPPLPLLELSQAEMAAADIANLPKASPGQGDSEVVGQGPHGETLYAAEWAREPTDAEMAGYMPRNAPDGWGVVACKTIPGNRVDDCVELGNSPGSHLARALRQAAWQFRVRPPRRNGRPMIGEWVRIHIDFTNIRDQ